MLESLQNTIVIINNAIKKASGAGSNANYEEIVYEDFKYFLEAVSVSMISQKEGAFLLKQFGKKYGIHPYFEIMNFVKDHEEEAND